MFLTGQAGFGLQNPACVKLLLLPLPPFSPSRSGIRHYLDKETIYYMKKTINSVAEGACTVKKNYLSPDSKLITMEPEGFIATSGELPDYGDGGSLSQMYNGKPLDDKFLKKA
jgi:hypothetical protein